MRTITKEYVAQRKNADDVLAYIMNTPRPDFTNLDKICKEFEVSMLKEQEKDRAKIAEAIKR